MTITESVASPARFPRGNRLRNAREFRAVYREGRRRSSRSFVVFFLATDSSAIRFGLTTPRRLGKAHARNRIRRRVREIIRCEKNHLNPGIDIVINPRRSVLSRNFAELAAELRDLLRASV